MPDRLQVALDEPPAQSLLLAEVAGYLARHDLSRLCEGGERVVVGCSGGADSLSLLVALRRLGVAAHAVYVDHGLRRGTEGEAAFVAEQAARFGATFAVMPVEVSRRGNLLAAAREARYTALGEAARGLGARWVAVGHTATDQAETIAFRRQRGDLVHALAGMPELRPLLEGVLLLRPLLAVTRAQTHAAIAALGLTPVADPSNEQPRYTRVRLRRELLAAGPAASTRLLALASAECAQLAADEADAAALGPLDALVAASVAAASSGVALRLLHRAGLHRAGLRHAQNLLALAASSDGTRTIDLGAGLIAERRYDRLRIGPRADRDAPDFELPLPLPGCVAVPGGHVEVQLVSASELFVSQPAVTERRNGMQEVDALDLDRLPPRLVLRNFRLGDRIRVRAGHRKLSDLLIDRKLPRPLRRRLPLLAALESHEVYWVAGWGPSESTRARTDARRLLQLRYLTLPSLDDAPARPGRAAETRCRGG